MNGIKTIRYPRDYFCENWLSFHSLAVKMALRSQILKM